MSSSLSHSLAPPLSLSSLPLRPFAGRTRAAAAVGWAWSGGGEVRQGEGSAQRWPPRQSGRVRRQACGRLAANVGMTREWR